ncbi:MAG: MaoC family dehydratase [Caulobacterales bacterium]|nr:MaoC family dehydratase [Caulobacterales bacterium]MCA0373457.1 MaoC family dehydratase [Pseudomonadota bacterium]
MANSRVFYFEDFVIGQEFLSSTYELTKEEIIEFAKKFDPQIFHTDEESAKQTFFGGLAASGWHTASISMKLQVESEMKVAGGMIGAGVEVSWPMPTRAGHILQVTSKVIDIKPINSRPSHGFVTMQSETKNQFGEILQKQVAKLFVAKKNQ